MPYKTEKRGPIWVILKRELGEWKVVAQTSSQAKAEGSIRARRMLERKR